MSEKIIRAYHKQLMEGCLASFCSNKYCKTSSDTSIVGPNHPMDSTDAALLSIELYKKSKIANLELQNPEYYFCVLDETVAQRRIQANTLSTMGFDVKSCIEALLECKDNVSQAASFLISRNA